MIVVSDNTATNLILDRIGGNAVNQRMAQLGLKQTAVMRKIMQHEAGPKGFTDEGKKPGNDRWGTGRSCPRDMVVLLEKLYRGQLVSKAASERNDQRAQTPAGSPGCRPGYERHGRRQQVRGARPPEKRGWQSSTLSMDPWLCRSP